MRKMFHLPEAALILLYLIATTCLNRDDATMVTLVTRSIIAMRPMGPHSPPEPTGRIETSGLVALSRKNKLFKPFVWSDEI